MTRTMSMRCGKPSEFIPIGIDIGSLYARVAIGDPNQDDKLSVDCITDTGLLPSIISNAQGSRYTLALVGTDRANADENADVTHHVFGEPARRALAREKKPTISKDPSQMVRELVRSSFIAKDENSTEKATAAAAFFSHLAEIACDASSSHPSNLRAVISVPVASTAYEQSGIVQTVERGINEALLARPSSKVTKSMKDKVGDEEDLSVMAVITDPAAVCLAHGLAQIEHPGVVDLMATKNEAFSGWQHALVVDWGASGLTATHISRTSKNSPLLTIVSHVHDGSCSGNAIVSALANHCASMFERKSRLSGVLDSKKACHRLEMACESAVRTLSRAPMVTVAVDGLYEGIDMNIPISRPRFDMLISGILRKAKTLLEGYATEGGVVFDVVLLAGNVCDMPSASNLVRTKLFPNAFAGREDVQPDEAVAIGCARHAASILSCDTRSCQRGKRRDDVSLGPSSRKVKTCPITIGICMIKNGEKNGHLEEAISKNYAPLIKLGDPLPANITKKIKCSNMDATLLSKSFIGIVQINGDAWKKNKVIGKIENVLLEDVSFEITVELSSAGKLSVSVNGGPCVIL